MSANDARERDMATRFKWKLNEAIVVIRRHVFEKLRTPSDRTAFVNRVYDEIYGRCFEGRIGDDDIIVLVNGLPRIFSGLVGLAVMIHTPEYIAAAKEDLDKSRTFLLNEVMDIGHHTGGRRRPTRRQRRRRSTRRRRGL